MQSEPKANFLPHHKFDRLFQIVVLITSWAVLYLGFAPSTTKYLTGELPAPPFILHIHAIVFFGWMLLYSAQSYFINARKLDLHRKLGKFTVMWSVLLTFIGIATAIIMNQYKFDHGRGHEIAFISVPLLAMVCFPLLITAAILAIKDPSAHKRLLLLALVELLGAAFGRALGPIFGPFFGKLLGDNMFSFWLSVYLGGYIMIFCAIIYDFFTRKQIHRVYLIAVPIIILCHLVAAFLFKLEAWVPIVRAIISR